MEPNRKKRVIVRKGDVFIVKFNDTEKRYFQYLANDPLVLNSDVIVAFENSYPIETSPDLDEVIKGKASFFAHCVVGLGAKMGLWEKVGHSNNVREVDIWFRHTFDYGHKLGEVPLAVSHNWHVWKINDEHFTNVGELKEKYREAEIGMVIAPHNILQRIGTGAYGFAYPSFE